MWAGEEEKGGRESTSISVPWCSTQCCQAWMGCCTDISFPPEHRCFQPSGSYCWNSTDSTSPHSLSFLLSLSFWKFPQQQNTVIRKKELHLWSAGMQIYVCVTKHRIKLKRPTGTWTGVPLPCSVLRQQVSLVENQEANNPKWMVSRPGRQKCDYFGFSLLRETSILQICDLKECGRMCYLQFQGEFR